MGCSWHVQQQASVCPAPAPHTLPAAAAMATHNPFLLATYPFSLPPPRFISSQMSCFFLYFSHTFYLLLSLSLCPPWILSHGALSTIALGCLPMAKMAAKNSKYGLTSSQPILFSKSCRHCLGLGGLDFRMPSFFVPFFYLLCGFLDRHSKLNTQIYSLLSGS